MALAERAELVARLTLDDKFSGKLAGVQSKLRGMEGSLGRIAGHASGGLKTAASNLAKIGAVAGGFVALNVQRGISSLAELEDATTSVDSAIAELGLTGKLTSQQVAAWANDIERNVQAAFDDKEITQAATTLLRFGKVLPDQLQPALVVMTDLAAKTGDVDSAATLLAKSLADPAKAAGKLARQGIILDDATQKQIKSLVEAGKVGEAQALVLQEIEKRTKGAAAAAKGPYNDALNTLRDVTEDAQRALGEAFLPLLGRVADKLSTFVGDPKNIEKLRGFGRDLADGFEKVLEIGARIPWGLIGESLTTAGKGAKLVFDAFAGLPPWIQTAVLTGWGLNKLTGGALGSIIGEGIKVTFGNFAARGATPANPLFVSQVGGVGGAGAGGGGGIAGAVGTAVAGGAAIQGVLDAATIATGVQRGYEAGQQGDLQGVLTAQQGILDNVVLVPSALRQLGEWVTGKQQALVDAITDGVEVKPQGISPDERQELNDLQAKAEAQRQKVEAVRNAAERTKASVDWSRQAITSGGHSDASMIVSAIRANRAILTVNVTTNTVVRTMQEAGVYSASHVGAYNKATTLL